jgi:hypothetical protein
VSIWFGAAGSLVLGIVIGFASGYKAGQGSNGVAAVAAPGLSTPAPTSGKSTTEQPFSESAVADPVRLDPEPVVPSPAPEPAPAVGRVQPPSGPGSGRPDPSTSSASSRAQSRDEQGRGAKADPPATRQVPAKADPPATRQVPAKADPPPAVQTATGPGSLQVVSRPAGAQVFLDGRSVGKTPLSIADVAAGEHGIRIDLPGFNRWSTTVDVKAGSPNRVAASLEQ